MRLRGDEDKGEEVMHRRIRHARVIEPGCAHVGETPSHMLAWPPKTVINSRGLFEHACTQASTHASLHLAARGYTPRPTAAASPPLHAPPPPSPSPSPPKPKHPCNKSGETPGADSVASMTEPVWECACQRRRETERGGGGRAPVRVCLCVCVRVHTLRPATGVSFYFRHRTVRQATCLT